MIETLNQVEETTTSEPEVDDERGEGVVETEAPAEPVEGDENPKG